MINVLSADQCREMDKRTIADIGIPGIVLMENAASEVYNKIKGKGKSFLIFCGKGNNGGDGLALARKLILDNKKVKVYIVSKDKNYTDSFKCNLTILRNIVEDENIIYINSEKDICDSLKSDLKQYDVTIDAIFGVGLNKDISGIFKGIIDTINESANTIAAIDVPSGLNSDTGVKMGTAIKSDITYTFEAVKRGFVNYSAFEYIGQMEVLKIGIPDVVKSKLGKIIRILEDDEYKRLIPERKVYGHKGNYGRAIVIAGSNGFTGAAFITTECTVRSGAGLTTLICSSKELQSVLENKVIEAMTITIDDEKIDNIIKNAYTIAVGPGIGTGIDQYIMLKRVISGSKCPIIIDADAINVLSDNKDLLPELKGRCIITPHPGEMARFLNKDVKEIEADRIGIARRTAEEYGIIVLLKGYNTIITDGENVYINPTGNSKMASGGMGDALTGIINAFVSQGISLIDSALFSAYIHGKIADDLSRKNYIINARDIIENLPQKINEIVTVR
ncbi:MAG: NAD(P)H-hydrate dehydratase [Clostridium sp.]|nr:NAD(P)H-hydrate dehydratase [Clostridium sp.]